MQQVADRTATLEEELNLIRLFHHEMSQVPPQAKAHDFFLALQQAIANTTGTTKFLILLWDDVLGSYQVLSDQAVSPTYQSKAKTQTLDVLSDHSLQELLNTDRPVLLESFSHAGLSMAFLALESPDFGSINSAVEQRPLLDAYTRMLAVLCHYLGSYVAQYLSLQQADSASWLSQRLKSLSHQMVSAMEEEQALSGALYFLVQELGFYHARFVEVTPIATPQDVIDDGLIPIGGPEDLATQDPMSLYGYLRCELSHQEPLARFFQWAPTGEQAGHSLSSVMKFLRQQQATSEVLSLDGRPIFAPAPLQVRSDRIRLFGLQPFLKQMPPEASSQTVWVLPVLTPSRESLQGFFLLFAPSHGLTLPDSFEELALEVCGLTARTLHRLSSLERILRLAHTDELTTLLNRRGFYERLEAEISRCRRHPRPLCIALIDVDHFKQLNDTYGHLSGDWVLRELGRYLRDRIRKSDVACRFGGEEFVLMLPDTPLEAATELLSRIRLQVRELNVMSEHGQPLDIRISAGVAPLREGQLNPKMPMTECIEQLLSEADQFLYQAKREGRDCVRSAAMLNS